MTKLLATCAAVAVTALLALPAPASAAERSTAGVQQTSPTDISAARRYYRRHYVRHYYGPRRYYGRSYYAPYNAYGYDPYYRPYYGPGVSVGVGPFGFGFGF
jgi:hypothetical protein